MSINAKPQQVHSDVICRLFLNERDCAIFILILWDSNQFGFVIYISHCPLF